MFWKKWVNKKAVENYYIKDERVNGTTWIREGEVDKAGK